MDSSMKRIVILLITFAAPSILAKSVDRTDPVNWTKVGVSFKVNAPEAIGFGLNVDAPFLEFFSLGGEISMTWALKPTNSPSGSMILRTNLVGKPRFAYDDRFEAYAKILLGPAFNFESSYNNPNRDAVGIDFAVLPGFQFSMSKKFGMFSEVGFGLTSFPRLSETQWAGIFRLGLFYSF